MEMEVLLALKANDLEKLKTLFNILFDKVESFPKVKKGEHAGRIGMSLNRNVGAEIYLPHNQRDTNFVALQ